MTSNTALSSLSTMNIGYESSTFPIIKTIFISCGLIKKITAISNWEKCTDWLLKWYFIVFKYVAWLLLQVTINKSLVPDSRQGCNWSFSRLIFLAYKSQDIEDETLTVNSHGQVGDPVVSLPCIFYCDWKPSDPNWR